MFFDEATPLRRYTYLLQMLLYTISNRNCLYREWAKSKQWLLSLLANMINKAEGNNSSGTKVYPGTDHFPVKEACRVTLIPDSPINSCCVRCYVCHKVTFIPFITYNYNHATQPWSSRVVVLQAFAPARHLTTCLN